jgi:hypothetical protein
MAPSAPALAGGDVPEVTPGALARRYLVRDAPSRTPWYCPAESLVVKTATVLALAALVIGIALGTEYTRLAAGSGAPAPSCRGSARAMARLEMLFGTSRPQGPPVSDDEWSGFLDSEVTPRFPEGLTVLRGPGQWRDGAGRLAKEQSNMLIIWHEPTLRTDADIEAIRSAYKERFEQESVLRIDSVSCVSF